MLATLILTAAVAQPPAAQPPAAGRQAVPAAPATAQQAYRVKQVLGTKVSLAGNVAIGTVDDIVFDDSGAIEYLIVLNEGKLVTVPWEAAKFDFKAQTAILSITPEQYKAVPTYTGAEYPNFYAPAYRTEIYRVYGLTPGQARRLNREIRR